MAFLFNKNYRNGGIPALGGVSDLGSSVAKWLCGVVFTALCSAAFGQPPSLQWGDCAPNFLLRDSLNRTVSLNRFKNQQVLVLVFSHYACPAHHLYLPKIKALEPLWQRLQGQALWILPHTLSASMVPHDQAILVQDLPGEAFAAYGIRKIPHVVVIQKKYSSNKNNSHSSRRRSTWTICYSGAVDADPENPTSSRRADLAEALRDLEFSEYVRIPKTALHGCPYPYTP